MRASPRVVLVAGLARDRTIGRAGGIPWRYPEDMRAFKRATMGTVLVMGRKTMESIGRALPGRVNVVVTRSPEAIAGRWPGAVAVDSLEAALQLAAELGAETVSVIGGGEIYRLALPLADELLLTFVPEDGGGDTFFPEWDDAEWTEIGRERLERVEVVRLARVVPPVAADDADAPDAANDAERGGSSLDVGRVDPGEGAR